tara:strand:- start:308 stop:688 length:381 start_codon:yes stop_codon:yes gene_type:complete
MATVTLTFANKINESAQVGDTAYYVTTSAQGGFTTSLNNSDPTTENVYVKIGTIKSIAAGRLSMVCNTDLTTGQVPTTSHFIFFSKDNIANMSTTLGYYAEVVLKNNSTVESELFSIGCDVFESSK